MTINEIKKAAEFCVHFSGSCKGCPGHLISTTCRDAFARALLASLKREEKLLAVMKEAWVDHSPECPNCRMTLADHRADGINDKIAAIIKEHEEEGK